MKYRRLDELGVNISSKVVALENQGSIRRRLQDMGIIEGTTIKCLFHSPFNEPTAYEVRGTVIGLRKEDAKLIVIE
ncbi:MAG: FeoA family protein [Eubacteriales bacterium]|nr:FeoA family protein [Eubacteriales bacterium]